MPEQNTIPSGQLVLNDFDYQASKDDEGVLKLFAFYYKWGNIFNKSLKFNSYSITRQPTALVIDFFQDGQCMAQFCFIPTPLVNEVHRT